MVSPLKVALVGAGSMGRRYIAAVQSLNLELVGVCDVQPEVLSLAAEEQRLSKNHQFADARNMLELMRPECVIVATTAPTHCEMTCLAAEVGAKFVMCEKPMASSLAECDRMIEVCRRHGTKLAVNHQMRFMEQYTEAKRIVSSEAFGGLKSVAVTAGNFGLAMNGTHYFEMFRFMVGEPPLEVWAWLSKERVTNPRGQQFEDRAGCVRLTTVSGARFYLDASHDHGHGFQVVYVGAFGQLTVDEATGLMRLNYREAAHRSQPTTRYLTPFKVCQHQFDPSDVVGPTRAVLEALLIGGDFPTGENGRSAIQVLSAAHLSDERGNRSVRVDDGSIDRERAFSWA